MSITFNELQNKLPWLTIKEGEWHQHPNGNGWVQNTATVHASACVEGIVYGNARVYGDAQVSGDARVYGDAQVSVDARVSGNAWDHSPLQIQASKHFVTTCSHTQIAIGCQVRTVTEWSQHYQAIGRSHGYTPDQIAEYGLLLAFAGQWLDTKFGGKSSKPVRDAKGRFVGRETRS